MAAAYLLQTQRFRKRFQTGEDVPRREANTLQRLGTGGIKRMTQHTVYIVSQHCLSKHEQQVLQGRAGTASSDNFSSVLAVSPLKYPRIQVSSTWCLKRILITYRGILQENSVAETVDTQHFMSSRVLVSAQANVIPWYDIPPLYAV